MLEGMRTHAQSWIAKLILGGIILSFALWGVADYFLGSRFEPVAEIDGEPVPPKEFVQAYERQLALLHRLLGENAVFGPQEKEILARNVLEQIIQQRMVQAEAARLGLVVPDEVIAATVRLTPTFQSAGQFDPERYRFAVRALGFATPRDYEKALSMDILTDQLRRLLADTAFISQQELHARFMQENERRELAAIVIDPDALPAPKITREQAVAWYEAHKNRYQTPEKVRFDLVVIDPDKIAPQIEVSEEDIRKFYEENKDRYRVPERWHLLHIFIRGTGEKEKKRIEEIRKRIEKGEDFLSLARKISDDAHPDLGWVRKGTLDPALEEAVARLSPGEITPAVKTARGWHLLKLVQVKPAGVRPLSEVKAEIAEAIRKQRAHDEAADLVDALDDALGRFDHLQQAAKEVGLKAETLGPISLAEARLDPRLQAPEVLQRLASMQPGDAIDLLELDDGKTLAIEVLKRIAPKLRPFEEVADLVLREAAEAKKKALAQEKAKALLASADGMDARTLAKKAGFATYFSEPIRRNARTDRPAWLTDEILASAFSAAPGTWLAKAFETPLGVAIVRVERRIAPSEAEFAKEKESLLRALRKEKAAVRFARWMASVRARHEIKINDQVLAQLAR